MPDLTQFMRDRDGIVHELHQSRFGWFWPQGHVDARTRVAEPVYTAVVTCFVCMDAQQKDAEFRARNPHLYGG